jgi:RHS repeat-associated protein
MTDASGTTLYTRDARHRLLSKATPQGSLSYTYDATGSLASVRSSNLDGVSVNYNYDAVNRLESVLDNRLPAGTTTYSYDAVGNVLGSTAANGVQSAYAYDTLDRLLQLTHSKGGTLAGYTHTLDPTGRRLSVTENNGRVVNYTYDTLYRLTNETVSGATPAAGNGSVGYTYDSVGNRLSRTSSLAAVVSATSAYDANDRLTTDSYDANGNTRAASGLAYTYDYENRVKSMNNGAVRIVYDGDGNRVSKTVGGVTAKYLVDDLNPSGYSQVVEEVVDGNVQRVYTYGHRLISQSQQQNGNWQTSFYGLDGHGNVRMLTDSNGAVTDTYTYDAFGVLISSSGATPNNYLYYGQQYDPDLGLYFKRARYYNQDRGRFMTMDPFAGRTTRPNTLHKYMFAGADPVNKIDACGMAETLEYPILTSQIILRALAQAAALAYAISCIFYQVASILDPGIIPLIPPAFAMCARRSRWTCEASCNVENFSNVPNAPARCTGSASGSSEDDACREAKRVATQSAVPGTYCRHCQCTCTRG